MKIIYNENLKRLTIDGGDMIILHKNKEKACINVSVNDLSEKHGIQTYVQNFYIVEKTTLKQKIKFICEILFS